jgi:hypothetical protein
VVSVICEQENMPVGYLNWVCAPQAAGRGLVANEPLDTHVRFLGPEGLFGDQIGSHIAHRFCSEASFIDSDGIFFEGNALTANRQHSPKDH